MTQKSNSLERFWQELKRRKVFGVVTTYAATAYIIIEVTNNLVEPLSLPAWIAKLVILLLGAGLPIVVILSWIFDFTPQGLMKTESLEELERREAVIGPVKRKQRASYVLNAVLIIAVIILAYPKIFKRSTLEKLRSSGERISVAVMPFQNITNDTTWNVWQSGIQEMLTNSFSNSEEFKVIPSESINALIQNKESDNYASLTPSLASAISKKLDANIFILGNIIQGGSSIRLYAKLINSKSGEVYKSFQVEGPSKEEAIIPIIDSLSIKTKNSLLISNLEKENIEFQTLTSTSSPEAYRYYVIGKNAYYSMNFPTAITCLNQACAIDSNFIWATWFLSVANQDFGFKEEAKKWALKLYRKKDLMPPREKLWTCYQYSQFFQLTEAIEYLKQLKGIDDQFPLVYLCLGWTYLRLQQYDNAIHEYEKYFKIYNRWGLKPPWAEYYAELGRAYHNAGEYKKEKNLYKKVEHDFPDDPQLIFGQAILSLSEGDTLVANDHIKKYRSLLKNNLSTEADIAADLATIYSIAGVFNKADYYYRQALLLEPEKPDRLDNLSYFLIDKNRDVNEGLELIDTALKSNPDNCNYLYTEGWGLYKQGKYKEAVKILQISWDLRRQYGEYNHEAYLHLEAAKKALAGNKNN